MMRLYAVTNGWMGNGPCTALVYAANDESAKMSAAEAFKKERFLFPAGGKGREYWTPNERWEARVLDLPFVCEMDG